MLNRRKLFAAAAVLAAAPLIPMTAAASPTTDAILAGLLAGVTDAAVSAYIRKHYREARWDGHYFYEGSRRYSRDEWRRELERRHRLEARRNPPPKPKPKPQPPRPPQGRPKDPPPPGGPGRGPHGGPGPKGRPGEPPRR